jgi:serine protease AprX
MKRLRIHVRPVLAGLVAAGLLFSAASVVRSAPRRRPLAKLSEKARLEAQAKGAGTVDVIVRFRNPPAWREVALLRGFGGLMRRHLRSRDRATGWTTVRVPGRAVAALANDPDVEFVTVDAPVYNNAFDSSREAAGLPAAPLPETAFTGAGVTIAMLDSGVAPHLELGSAVTRVDAVGGNPTIVSSANDEDGHGTHIAGVLIGNGSRSDGRFRGVAPGAGLVSVKVLDGSGVGRTSDVIAGLQWVIAHKDALGIRVLNLSLGHPVYEPAATDPLVQALEEVWDAGIVVVCAAGNNGTAGHGGINSPCNSPKVITVGATNDRGTATTADDSVASYSSRGPTLHDLVAKPDLLAPGNRIVSARSSGSRLDLLFPLRRISALPLHFEHAEMSGTSMAAPFVAGTAALMLQQDPSLNPATVKARLMLSATKPAVGDPFATGAGLLNVTAALRTGGHVAVAPSPRVQALPTADGLSVENTAILWSHADFSLRALWSPTAVLWSDASEPEPALLTSTGVVLTAGTSGSSACLWPDAILEAEATLWPDAFVAEEATLWPDEAAQ